MVIIAYTILQKGPHCQYRDLQVRCVQPDNYLRVKTDLE
jgi:hypothetical protein